ncbi:excisionase family DNA-binding protein [Amycolatopsis sp. CA-128772]|uniref:excisionase family DNA-binding protein n=1 Tax=Amycolatopsis sp. CA-128772 TaxID=2073159 RepID=UPI001E5AF4F8|nr:excisionase family DNA-binding protein [Amycolatopsis sp. CA-128772]
MANAESPSLYVAADVNSGETLTGPREMLTVEQAADRLAVSRTTMFALIKDDVVPSVLIGRNRRVPADELTAYIERLIAEAGEC